MSSVSNTNSSSASSPDTRFTNFLILTPRLILVPTPTAITIKAYRDFYGYIHSLTSFCEMAFGSQFKVQARDDQQTHELIEQGTRKDWWGKGLGDFAVGQFDNLNRWIDSGKSIGTSSELRVVEGDAYVIMISTSNFWNSVTWVGYAGVRDASTRMPSRTADDPALPPWQEMIEIRYGVGPDHWGKGIAPEAGGAVIRWAVSEKGTRRFVAGTEKANARSGAILKKFGFVEMVGSEYWKDDGITEWEKAVG